VQHLLSIHQSLGPFIGRFTQTSHPSIFIDIFGIGLCLLNLDLTTLSSLIMANDTFRICFQHCLQIRLFSRYIRLGKTSFESAFNSLSMVDNFIIHDIQRLCSGAQKNLFFFTMFLYELLLN